MNNFTKLLFLTALVTGTALAAPPGGGPGGSGQGQQRPEQDQQRPKGPDMKALAEQLGLSDDQAARLKTIMEKQRQTMHAMHQAGQQQGEAAMQQRHAQRDKFREELLTVLSYEQLYKFEKFMEQNRPRAGSSGGGSGMQRPSSRPE